MAKQLFAGLHRTDAARVNSLVASALSSPDFHRLHTSRPSSPLPFPASTAFASPTSPPPSSTSSSPPPRPPQGGGAGAGAGGDEESAQKCKKEEGEESAVAPEPAVAPSPLSPPSPPSHPLAPAAAPSLQPPPPRPGQTEKKLEIRALLLDFAASLIPGLAGKSINVLFSYVKPAIKDSDSLIQKRAYKVLSMLLKIKPYMLVNLFVHFN